MLSGERLQELIRKQRDRKPGEGGFTLIELLVVIIILGILAAVVVFAVGGVGDKGASSAAKQDVRTLRTAEEASMAQFGTYATEAELVQKGLLAEESQKHDIVLIGDAGINQSYRITSPPAFALANAGDGSVPIGGTIKVSGTNTPGNVTGDNFVNPAVTSSGTSHPNVEYMFNGLMRWAENNTIQPDLAQSYTISPDQQTVAFTLRPGMVWHNNTPILNSDVEFTVEKALIKYHSRTGPSLTPALGGTGGGTSVATIPAAAITLPSSGVVQFNFIYGYAGILLRQMNVTEGAILPKNVYEPCDNTGTDNINLGTCPANNPTSNVDFPADTATNKSPVGSGPFRFKSRNSTTAALVFVNRNTTGGVGATPYHLAGLPFAAELQQVPVANSANANALLAKTVDVSTPENNRILPITPPNQTSADITPANGFTTAPVPRGAGGGNCINTFAFHLWNNTTTTNSIGALAPNFAYNHAIFGDPAIIAPNPGAGRPTAMTRGQVVRRAISMAVDRAAIFNARDFGKGRLADSPYHSKLPPYSAQAAFPAFNTATAATWLDDAGWTVQGGTRKANFTYTTTSVGGVSETVTAATTPLAWKVRRVTGGQETIYQDMKTQLAAAPINIAMGSGAGVHAEVAADTSTNTTGGLVNGPRNFDMLVVSYCAGDDPVIGVRRQYHSDGIPAAGAPSNFTNPAGVRSTVMDGYWNTAFGSNYTAMHQAIQADSANAAYQLYFSESSTTRAWRTGCSGFNNYNTGLYVETASCI